jgi:hypothetical protein
VDQRERQVIDELFGKLRQVDGQAPQRDADAERYIREQVASLPAAPYYMAQAILVQEQALATLQTRVQELERQSSERQAGSGGFLSGLFGGGQQQQMPAPRPMPRGSSPWGTQPGVTGGHGSPWGRPAGGGFLAGAMQTALGVAGGMLVASALTSAFDGGAAEAAGLAEEAGLGGEEMAPEAEPAGYAEDTGATDMGDTDMGGFGEEI